MHSAKCKFCGQTYQVMLWDTKPRFPQHRMPDNRLIACDGSGELLEIAAVDAPRTAPVERYKKIPGRRGTNISERMEKATKADKKGGGRLNPKLGYSKLPSFYETREW